MQILRDHTPLPKEALGAAVAIGNFDGIHLGHRSVLHTMLTEAERLSVPRAVLTFEPHPRMFFSSDTAPLALEPFHVKARRLRALGVEWLHVLRFDEALSRMSAEVFIADILTRRLRAAHLVTGENFVFGHRRGGDASLLRAEAQAGRFGYSAVAAVDVQGSVCSSSAIREALKTGNPCAAAQLLGRTYSIGGRVVHGQQRGRTLGFPTANLALHGLFLPRYGVYAARLAVINVDDCAKSPRHWQDAVANLGVRPTVDTTEKAQLEVHVLEGAPQLYGKRVQVQLLHFLREEQKFAGLDALTRQIAVDVDAARDALAQPQVVLC